MTTTPPPIEPRVPCDNCGDDTGWEWHQTFGWVACADCNDDMEKPKPLKKFAEAHRN